MRWLTVLGLLGVCCSPRVLSRGLYSSNMLAFWTSLTWLLTWKTEISKTEEYTTLVQGGMRWQKIYGECSVASFLPVHAPSDSGWSLKQAQLTYHMHGVRMSPSLLGSIKKNKSVLSLCKPFIFVEIRESLFGQISPLLKFPWQNFVGPSAHNN